jgi:hypothetical protein
MRPISVVVVVFPFVPGDADDRRRARAEEQADLRQHRDPALQRAKDRGRPWANAVDHEHELRVGERGVIARRPQHELDRRIADTPDTSAS